MKHGYWKYWGHAVTCSECGFCEEDYGDNYCMRCGAIMDGEPQVDIPTFPHLSALVTRQCPHCGLKRISAKDATCFNYCPNCGQSMGDER